MKTEIIEFINHKRAKSLLLLDAINLLDDADLTSVTAYSVIFAALRGINSADNYQSQIDPVVAAGEIVLMNQFIADIVKLKA